MPVLTATRLDDELKSLAGWSREGDAIFKQYTFPSFLKAIAFINAIAPLAEAADHHPDLRNVYNRVTIHLSTHDEGGVTEKDIALARKIEDILSG